EELWASYSSKLETYIKKHIQDKYDAEDILQEVAIRIQQNVSRLKDIINVKGWLYRIAHNLIVDYYRGANKYSLIEDINELSALSYT
ncbi:MAG: sigma factor, partial [Bacteroidota bacterium]